MYTGIIADDATIMRLRLTEILGKEFDIVAVACNGQEALDFYDQFKSDFITLDISMPEKDGITVLQELLEKYPDVKVIMVSAVGQKQIVFDALSIGAKDFVVKPFEPERVLKAVQRLFE